ncbi:MAG: hypothetical protein M3458_05355 [Acidobacteriota bacterium]|nr:hypothetical protein [Acidobacteriota bacterium]
MTAYLRQGNELFFDPGCDCTGGAPLEPRSWDSVAEWINIQSDSDARESLARSFGLKAI